MHCWIQPKRSWYFNLQRVIKWFTRPGVWARRWLSDTNGSPRWLVTGHPWPLQTTDTDIRWYSSHISQPHTCRPSATAPVRWWLHCQDQSQSLGAFQVVCVLIHLSITPLRHNYDSDAARTNWYNLEIFAFAVCSYFASMTNYGGKDSTLCIIILRISQNKFSSPVLSLSNRQSDPGLMLF